VQKYCFISSKIGAAILCWNAFTWVDMVSLPLVLQAKELIKLIRLFNLVPVREREHLTVKKKKESMSHTEFVPCMFPGGRPSSDTGRKFMLTTNL
jgi:hypothetical protein